MKYLVLGFFLIASVVIYSRGIKESIREMEAESSEHKKNELELDFMGNVICLIAMPVFMIGLFEYLTT